MSFHLLTAMVPHDPLTHECQEAKQRWTSRACSHVLPGYTYILLHRPTNFYINTQTSFTYMSTLRTNQTPLRGKAVPVTKQRHEYSCLTAGVNPRVPSPGEPTGQ